MQSSYEASLARLNDQQRAAATATSYNAVIEAVPGSGKTTTLVARIAYLIKERHVDPSRICVMTYTKAAVADVEKRLAETFPNVDTRGVRICTIHSLANSIIYDFFEKNNQPLPKVIQESDIKHNLREIVRQEQDVYLTDEELSSYAECSTFLKNNMLSPKDIPDTPENKEIIAMYSDYQRAIRLTDSNAIDYDDMLTLAQHILERYEEPRQAIQNRYDWWLIDEAQDCSPLQYALFDLVVTKGHVTLVGDSDQSIYAFRGADPSLLLNRLLDPTYKRFDIETNYRSKQEITDLANAFNQKGQDSKHIIATHPTGAIIETKLATTKNAQYRRVTQFVKRNAPNVAILYRNNDSAVPLAEYLMRNNISFQVRNPNTQFFTSRPVLDVLAMLHLAEDMTDVDAFMRIYYKLRMYVTKSMATAAANNATRNGTSPFVELMKLVKGSPNKEKRVWKAHHMLQSLSDRNLSSQVTRIMKSDYRYYLKEYGGENKVTIMRHLATQVQTVSELEALLERIRAAISATNVKDPQVTLCTLHSAKGLEWNSVAIIDLNANLFPTTTDNTDSLSGLPTTSYAEERRLMYVGITRARNNLLMTSSSRNVSEFLEQIEYQLL